MRICYVTETYPPEINGVSLTVGRVVDDLRARGHAVQLVRPRQRHEDPRDDAEEWRSPGAPIPVYPDLRFGWSSVGRMRRRLEQDRPTIVHVATPGPLGWAAVEAAVRLGLPATIDFRTNFHWYSGYYGFGVLKPLLCGYLRHLHNRATATFAPTHATQRQLRQSGFQRVEVLGRGVDTDQFSPARRSEALRRSWGAAPADPVLLYVGRLAPEKNVGLALRAYAAARARCAGATLVVVGDGPLRRSLERQCPDGRFVGMQRGDALGACYASADLLLFPSESETFGNVTLEGLASGLGVIAFDLAAAGEHVTDARNGWLARTGDDAGFVHAVVRAVASDPKRLAELRRRARDEALRTRWDDVLQRFEGRLMSHALHGNAPATGHAVAA